MSELDATTARAYLLGRASDLDRDATEQRYFENEEAIDTMAAAEEALIEEYLAGQLTSDDRVSFERYYLATEEHRTRVETIRQLQAASAPGIPARSRRLDVRTVALAAGVAVAVGGGLWIAYSRSQPLPKETTAPARVPSVFAFALSPVSVRGAADTPSLIVPAGIDVVALQFEASGAGTALERGRIVIRTVAGSDVWQGPIDSSARPPSGMTAVASVPSDRLSPDDYIVTLIEVTSSGAQSERDRYFLRVRSR